MRPIVRDQLPLVLIVALYLCAGAVFGALLGIDVVAGLDPVSLIQAAGWCFLVVGIVAGSYTLVFLFERVLRRARGARVGSANADAVERVTWADFRRRYLPLSRALGLFIVLFVLVPFMSTFIGFKGAIPVVQPFAWDPTFMGLDRALHFGRHPWQLLHPVLGFPWVTVAVDLLYYLWFPVLGLTLVWQGWTDRRELGAQFFVSYAAVWILLGTVLATAFSSAGPCYYGKVTGLPDPFAPLMEYLQEVNGARPLFAIAVQTFLWEGYAGVTAHPIEGIAAMPSVHVAVPVLFAVLGWRTHRWLGIAYTGYAAIVLIGSVHLGWHYAIDGYVGAATVPLIWKASGFAVRHYYRRTGPTSSL